MAVGVAHRYARIGTNAGTSNDHDFASFEESVGNTLQKHIFRGGYLSGRHVDTSSKSAHWTGS